MLDVSGIVLGTLYLFLSFYLSLIQGSFPDWRWQGWGAVRKGLWEVSHRAYYEWRLEALLGQERWERIRCVVGPLWNGSGQGKGEPQRKGQSGIGSEEKSLRGGLVKGPKYQWPKISCWLVLAIEIGRGSVPHSYMCPGSKVFIFLITY